MKTDQTRRKTDNWQSKIIACLCCMFLTATAFAKDVNMREYGAKADGVKDNTALIQRAIDECSASGGGVVYFPAGKYMAGTFYLKDNVTINLHKMATIQGIARIDAYPGKSEEMALVRAHNATNVSITGDGTIDGDGGHSVFQKGMNSGDRPALVWFDECTRVTIKDVRLVNSAFWTVLVLGCEHVRINGINIHGHVGWNNDGINIDSRNVIISDCFIDALDDGICLKSRRSEPCENVTITNCNIASTCNPIKMGTQSVSGFRNIVISNCIVRSAPKDLFFKWQTRLKDIYAETSCIAGIAMEIVDGGVMEQVNISNITMTGVQTPVFIKLGARSGGKGTLKNIIISGITATTVSKMASSITGFPGNYVENVVLRDIIIRNVGHGTEEDALIVPPENEKEYPENRMFGDILPSYGFFVRHVKNIFFDNVQVQLLNKDARPALYFDDVENLSLNHLQADKPSSDQPLIHFNKVKSQEEYKIDREALVKRHNVQLDKLSDSELLQVGNGEIAFGIDATGLQTFYGNTMSQWGWHSVPCPVEGGHAALKLEEFDFHGRKLSYRSSAKGQEELFFWMWDNPHRLCLGRLRFLIKKDDGQFITPDDVKEIHQTLDLWHGIIESRYEIEGVPVCVETCVEPETGTLAVQVVSSLIKAGRLQVEWAFPYAYHGHEIAELGSDWTKPDAHRTTVTKDKHRIDFARQLDTTTYHAAWSWDDKATCNKTAPHTFVLTPDRKSTTFRFVVQYAQQKIDKHLPTVKIASEASKAQWPAFWQSGGVIDLSGSRDPRWKELERRIVLSQYLLAVNEAGSYPPQESGLFNNSAWSGKFHLEMHWWHGAHYGLWGRWPMMEKSLWWYHDILPKSKELAQSQGFTGARWPKMIGPDAEDSPSNIGPLLIWQQPHPIFYAELEYRLNPTKATLEKWRDIIQQAAEFMASFATFDEATQHYVLGPPLAAMPENTNFRKTWNPTFELSYWRTGLRWAQTWRERLGLPREQKWDDVIQKLAPLPQQDGVYLLQENMPETYTKKNWEHPSLIGPGGMLPGDGTDPAVMKKTVEKVWATWDWDKCWGSDFLMMAMAAARNGNPQMAIDALLHPSFKNAINKVGLSTGGPFPYFPTNGGILYAVALMAAGWDGAPDRPAPGFPNDGTWTVRSEGLAPAP